MTGQNGTINRDIHVWFKMHESIWSQQVINSPPRIYHFCVSPLWTYIYVIYMSVYHHYGHTYTWYTCLCITTLDIFSFLIITIWSWIRPSQRCIDAIFDKAWNVIHVLVFYVWSCASVVWSYTYSVFGYIITILPKIKYIFKSLPWHNTFRQDICFSNVAGLNTNVVCVGECKVLAPRVLYDIVIIVCY